MEGGFIMGNRLRELRELKGLTLKELVDDLKKVDLKISSDTLAKYERGDREPKLERWQKLADYFDVSVSYLQGTDDFINYGLQTFKEIYGDGYKLSNDDIFDTLYSLQALENIFGLLIEKTDDDQINEMKKTSFHTLNEFVKILSIEYISMYSEDNEINKEQAIEVMNKINSNLRKFINTSRFSDVNTHDQNKP